MSEPAFQLSPEQSSALVQLKGVEDFYCLKGYAGTGKTTVITRWIKEYKPRNVVLTAPTNKAVNVLREKSREAGIYVQTATIHSLLSLKMKWVLDKQELVPDERGDNRFGEFDWVVIDECSMLDASLMEYIKAAQGEAKNKVIFMGDPCQLPPINEKESLSFQHENTTELKEVQRQGRDSPILSLSTYLRELILSDRPGYPAKIFSFVDNKHILHRPIAQFESEILEAFARDEGKDIRHLAWTNKVVDAWNNKIRDRIYGFDREDWTRGEQIVTTAPVIRDQEVIFSTDTLLKIQQEPKVTEIHEVPCWELVCKDIPLHVYMEGTGYRMYRQKREYFLSEAKKDPKKWRTFYDFVESFAYIKPAHSMTVHRSQGSTFDDVYVSLGNILANPKRKESLQCLYVAVTRPKNRLILV